MIDDQDVVPLLTETMIFARLMMPTDGPGIVHARTATITHIPVSPIGNDLVKRGTFMNVVTPTTNLMKDIINSIACPGVHVKKPRHA
jgi:hypothetical protein